MLIKLSLVTFLEILFLIVILFKYFVQCIRFEKIDCIKKKLLLSL